MVHFHLQNQNWFSWAFNQIKLYFVHLLLLQNNELCEGFKTQYFTPNYDVHFLQSQYYCFCIFIHKNILRMR